MKNVELIIQTAKDNWQSVYENLGIEFPKRGRFIICPFHNDSHPSAVVNEDGSIHCYACNTHKGIVDIVEHYRGYDFKEAIRFLGDMFNISTDASGKEQDNPEMDEFYLDTLFKMEAIWVERFIKGFPALPKKRSLGQLRKKNYDPLYMYETEEIASIDVLTNNVETQDVYHSDLSYFELIKYDKTYRENLAKALINISSIEDNIYIKRIGEILQKKEIDKVFYSDYVKYCKIDKKPYLSQERLEKALKRWD